MLIRPARLSDRENIALTHKASIETLCAGHYGARQTAEWAQVISPGVYTRAIQEKIMLVAEREGEIIGLGILDLENQTINALYVHPGAAGAGAGKNLLLEMERKASENGLNNLTLNSTINAWAFYEKHGYTGSGKSFHELPNGVRLECIGMHKKIGPTTPSR